MSEHLAPRASQSAESADCSEGPLARVIQFPTQRERGIFLPNSTHESSGVIISDSIPERLLDGFDIDPVLDRSVGGLGEVCLKGVRFTKERGPDQPRRVHRLYTVERYGYHHAVEITDPVAGPPRYIIASSPGWTEPIEGAIRKQFQAGLAHRFPDARITSFGSNGIGQTGDRYSSNDRSHHGLLAMAAQRVALAKALGSELPVIGVQTSMGTVIGHRLAEMNLFDTPPDGKINLVGQIWISPALVDPKNVKRDMVLNFLPRMGGQIAKELIFRSSPSELVEIALAASRYGSSREDRRAIGHQMVELLQGTDEQRVDDVVSVIPTLVVTGSEDRLAQLAMMRRLQEKYGPLFKLEVVEGRAHELCMKPGRACDKISRAGQFLVEQALATGAQPTA